MKFNVKRDIQVMMPSRIIHLSVGTYETSDKIEIEKLNRIDDVEVVKTKTKKSES